MQNTSRRGFIAILYITDNPTHLTLYLQSAIDKGQVMHQVQLDERLYKEAQRRASEAGFASVDEYVADVVSHDLIEDSVGETPNLDHLFTPERLAHIDAAAAQIEAGNYFTAEQVREHFKKKRAAWIQQNRPR
jgi:hypothetical protein